jgi:spore coat protein CotH
MVISDEDVQNALDRLRFKASDAAKAKAERIYCEEFRKVVKANIMQHHLDMPVSAQERQAYSSEDYKKHLAVMRDAIEHDERCRWQMIAAQAVIDAWRTCQANHRIEARIG